MDSERSRIGEVVLASAFFASSVFPGCSPTAGESPRIESPKTVLPIVLASSADFGCLRSDSGPVSRIVGIRNSTNSFIHVSRWTISCECLTIEPSSIDVGPAKAAYIRLVFDPSKEGEGFVGSLRMSVEGFGDAGRVCTFDVPVSVVAAENLRHLDGLVETSRSLEEAGSKPVRRAGDLKHIDEAGR